MTFVFAGSLKFDGSFFYDGIDLMAYQHEWERPNNEFITHKVYIARTNEFFYADLYELTMLDKKIIFLAGEITNSVWGFAIPKELINLMHLS